MAEDGLHLKLWNSRQHFGVLADVTVSVLVIASPISILC